MDTWLDNSLSYFVDASSSPQSQQLFDYNTGQNHTNTVTELISGLLNCNTCVELRYFSSLYFAHLDNNTSCCIFIKAKVLNQHCLPCRSFFSLHFCMWVIPSSQTFNSDLYCTPFFIQTTWTRRWASHITHLNDDWHVWNNVQVKTSIFLEYLKLIDGCWCSLLVL